MACVKIRSIKKQHIQKRELNIRVKRQSHGSDMNMQTTKTLIVIDYVYEIILLKTLSGTVHICSYTPDWFDLAQACTRVPDLFNHSSF